MPDLITEEIDHVKGHPKRLVVFLHGYIDSSEATDKSIAPLIERLDDVAVHVPQSPFTCEIHPNKRQWYSMHRFDPNDDRKTVPTRKNALPIMTGCRPDTAKLLTISIPTLTAVWTNISWKIVICISAAFLRALCWRYTFR